MLWKRRATVNSSCCLKRNFQPSKENVTALACITCDVNSQVDSPTVFQNRVRLSVCAWTNLTSHSLQKINLFHMSVWREQPNNSMFLSSSWKSSCTMFVLCKAAWEQPYSNSSVTSGLGTFPQLLRNIKGRGERSETEVTCLRLPSGRYAKY